MSKKNWKEFILRFQVIRIDCSKVLFIKAKNKIRVYEKDLRIIDYDPLINCYVCVLDKKTSLITTMLFKFFKWLRKNKYQLYKFLNEKEFMETPEGCYAVFTDIKLLKNFKSSRTGRQSL